MGTKRFTREPVLIMVTSSCSVSWPRTMSQVPWTPLCFSPFKFWNRYNCLPLSKKTLGGSYLQPCLSRL